MTEANEKIEDLPARLRICADLLGSMTALAKAAGVAPRNIQGYARGENEPKASVIAKIGLAAEVDLAWLLTGMGEMRAGQALSGPQGDPVSSDKVEVPVLNVEVSAGNGSHPEGEDSTGTMAFQDKYLAARGLQASQLRMVFAKGDSMEPEIQDGAAMLVNMADQRLDDGCIYVLRLNDHLFAKRVQRGFDGSVSLMSTNSHYSAMPVPADRMDDLTVIGRVVWSGREH